MLINFFYGDKIPNDETLKKMEAQLQLYASDSHVLIARYFFDRYREQKVVTDFPLGSVNIKVHSQDSSSVSILYLSPNILLQLQYSTLVSIYKISLTLSPQSHYLSSAPKSKSSLYTANSYMEITVEVQWNNCNADWSTVFQCM